MWEIYLKLAAAIPRTSEGIYTLIPPSEYESWLRLTDTLVYSGEYDILVAMDRLYCDEANKELEDKRSRDRDELQRKIDQANKAGNK